MPVKLTETQAAVLNLLEDTPHTRDELINTFHVADGGDYDAPVTAALEQLTAAGMVRERSSGHWEVLASANQTEAAAARPWEIHVVRAAEANRVDVRIEPRARVLELGFIYRDDERRQLVGVFYQGSKHGSAALAERRVRRRLCEIYRDVDQVEWEPITIESHVDGVVHDRGAYPGVWVEDVEPGEVCTTLGCTSRGEFEPYTDGQTLVHFASSHARDHIMSYREGGWFISTDDDCEIRSRDELAAYIEDRRRQLSAQLERVESLNARAAAECDECWGAPPAGTTCERCGTPGRGDAA